MVLIPLDDQAIEATQEAKNDRLAAACVVFCDIDCMSCSLGGHNSGRLGSERIGNRRQLEGIRRYASGPKPFPILRNSLNEVDRYSLVMWQLCKLEWRRVARCCRGGA